MVRRILLLVTALALAGCGGGSGIDEPGEPQSITVTSAAFTDGGPIPTEFTCAGAGSSPPVSWSGVPGEAKSLVLEVQDPDAPGGSYVHWLAVNLPPENGNIAAGAPAPGVERENSADETGWTPPCPPSGTHHYHFRIYALDVDAVPEADAAGVSKVVDQHLVAWGELVGTVAAGSSGGGGY